MSRLSLEWQRLYAVAAAPAAADAAESPPPLADAQGQVRAAVLELARPADWAALQAECCADLRPARLQTGPVAAFAAARKAAERMPGWEVVGLDESNGTSEAVATSTVFGFQDDVAIRVRPDGASSVVAVMTLKGVAIAGS